MKSTVLANMDSVLAYSWFYPVIELLSSIALALIIWYGGGRMIQGAIELGALVAFIQYSERFFRPIADLSEKYNILQSAMASSERVFALLDTPVEISNPANAVRPTVAPAGDIEFRNVWFAYDEGELGSARRFVPGQSGGVGCDCGAHWRGQDDGNEPAHAVL